MGRLDADTEGLLLLTNDGSLAHKLMHPSYEVPKTYLVEVAGPLPRAVGRALLAGVELEDGPARVDAFKLVQAIDKSALVEVVLHEGRNRIVRRHVRRASAIPVQRLVRTAIGPDQARRPEGGPAPPAQRRRDRRAFQACGAGAR